MASYSLLTMTQMCLARMEKKPVSTLASHTDESRYITDTLTSAHRWICGIHGWDWLRTEAEIVLVPAVAQASSINITSGASAATFSTIGTGFLSYTGGLISITTRDVVRILSGTSATGASLQIPYLGATVTNLSGSILQDTYALPANFDRPQSSSSFIAAPWKMTAYDPERFLKLRTYDSALVPMFATSAQPDSYTTWGNGDGTQKLIVWPFPAVAQTLSIRYIRKPAEFAAGLTDGSAIYPEIPEKFQNVLIHRALDLYYRDKEVDMTKRGVNHAFFNNILQQMLGTVERTSDRMAMSANTSRAAYGA